MKYVRQLKKKGKDSVQTSVNQFQNSEGTGYDFPEIEEFFIYTPGSSNGTGYNNNSSGSKVLR